MPVKYSKSSKASQTHIPKSSGLQLEAASITHSFTANMFYMRDAVVSGHFSWTDIIFMMNSTLVKSSKMY